jgi:hypothetical protein
MEKSRRFFTRRTNVTHHSLAGSDLERGREGRFFETKIKMLRHETVQSQNPRREGGGGANLRKQPRHIW